MTEIERANKAEAALATPAPRDEAGVIEAAAVTKRLAELREIASEEELPLNELSFEEAAAFLATLLEHSGRPSIFMLDNGNIDLMWGEGDKMIKAEFKGNGVISFYSMALWLSHRASPAQDKKE